MENLPKLTTRQEIDVLNMSVASPSHHTAPFLADIEQVEPEPYAIVEEPCGAGFRYVGLATPEEYEKYMREHPLAYG